jgi:hypothetical protein
MTEFRVPARLRGEGRLLVALAFGLIAFAAYFLVGVVRGRLSAIHLVIAVLSVVVGALTIWSQRRAPLLLRADADRLVIAAAEPAVYPWVEVRQVELVTQDGRLALAVALVDVPEPVLVPLDASALPPLEVLHGIRLVAPGHVAPELG